jgi:hypothetical protein
LEQQAVVVLQDPSGLVVLVVLVVLVEVQVLWLKWRPGYSQFWYLHNVNSDIVLIKIYDFVPVNTEINCQSVTTSSGEVLIQSL